MASLLSSEQEINGTPPAESLATANPLWSNIFQAAASRKDVDGETSQILKQIPVFEELGRRELAAVVRILYERTYQAEELIFRQNDPGVGMYIIVHGTIAILRE